MVSRELLDILACPDCKQPVVLCGETLICVNADCRRRYRIDDDIPVMLIDESEVMAPADWSASPAAANRV